MMPWTTTTMSCPKTIVIVGHDNVAIDIRQIVLHRLVHITLNM